MIKEGVQKVKQNSESFQYHKILKKLFGYILLKYLNFTFPDS